MILDVGCGSAPQDFVLAKRAARIVGIGPGSRTNRTRKPSARTWAPDRDLELRCTTIEHAGFEPQQFDKVVSFSVLEHITNRDEVLDVIARVLKPGGELIFSCDSMATMTDANRRARHQADHWVQTYFTDAEVRAMLEARGFSQIRIRPLFKSPYSLAVFEAAVDRAFHFHRYGKFVALLRMKLEEYRHRHKEQGLFLLIHAVKQA